MGIEDTKPFETDDENFCKSIGKALDGAIHEPQPHTIKGKRGQQEVKLKEIQVAECILRGMLDGATHYSEDSNYSKTEILEFDHLVDIIYKVRWLKDFDPVAVVQNACCHMEKVMGIFPNIPKLDNDHEQPV